MSPWKVAAVVEPSTGECVVLVPRKVLDALEDFVAAGGVLPEEPDLGPRTYSHAKGGPRPRIAMKPA